ncbi:hypothetical protein FM120_00395 [Sphingobacterium faecium PCAi_F2.5]|nr:hypothetical protein FM120_00395 [Sphingobacterium faecium PCAi_F2.5]
MLITHVKNQKWRIAKKESSFPMLSMHQKNTADNYHYLLLNL